MRIVLVLIACAAAAVGADRPPELWSWVMATLHNAVAPEVHSVGADGDFIYVESAGLSLHSFGSLEANQYDPPLGPRSLTFRIPRHPKPAEGEHESTPLGIIGVFATGVPIYNPIGTNSYRDQNIWHVDAIAASKAGISRLVRALESNPTRHSPIIGYALDGYPIYGPFGWDADGTVRRMRSSYRLRRITRRTSLPDGRLLTPAQEGPAVSAQYPLGTFAEDYEFVAGSGELDQFNGRLTRTPDYPHGTYAYFLTQWPYLIGPRYYGTPAFETQAETAPRAGAPATLTFTFKDDRGRKLRFLEKIHEKPVHMIVVSRDLAEFAHIHPEPAAGGVFAVTHTFDHGGDYFAFADYTAPGAGPAIQKTEIHVAGEHRAAQPLRVDTELTKIAGGVRVTLDLPEKLETGADLPLSFRVNVNDLEPYLGAWAHIMLVSGDLQTFIHAHPIENPIPGADPMVHTHAGPSSGRNPMVIRTVTGFDQPGLYKLWFQFQRHGEVETAAWVLRVAGSGSRTPPAPGITGAIPVRVSSSGFSPARLTISANRKSRIASTRDGAQNCASEVVFPELGIRAKLAPGETTLVDLPAAIAGELHFACGRGMFKGDLVVR